MDILFKLKILFWILHGSFIDWKDNVFTQDLDTYYCCDGRECGCDGITLRELYSNYKP